MAKSHGRDAHTRLTVTTGIDPSCQTTPCAYAQFRIAQSTLAIECLLTVIADQSGNRTVEIDPRTPVCADTV